MQRSRKVVVVLGAVLLIGSLAAAVQAGTWYSARYGQVSYYYASGLADGGADPLGMDLYLKTNNVIEVNYSIPGSTYDWPVFFQHKVRWVRVNAKLYSADVRVTAVYAFDGATLLSGTNWGWDGGWKNGYHDIYVDLGANYDIKKGLGLVVYLQSGTDAMANHNVEIHAVSARVD